MVFFPHVFHPPGMESIHVLGAPRGCGESALASFIDIDFLEANNTPED